MKRAPPKRKGALAARGNAMIGKLGVAAIAALAGLSGARADDTIQAAVKSGATQAFGPLGSVNSNNRGNDCTGGVLPTISRPPAHGKLDLRIEMRPVTNKAVACVGQMIRVAVPYYTAAKGYAGPDEFVLQLSLFNGRTDITNYYTFQITVK